MIRITTTSSKYLDLTVTDLRRGVEKEKRRLSRDLTRLAFFLVIAHAQAVDRGGEVVVAAAAAVVVEDGHDGAGRESGGGHGGKNCEEKNSEQV